MTKHNKNEQAYEKTEFIAAAYNLGYVQCLGFSIHLLPNHTR